MKPNVIFLMIDSFSANKFYGEKKSSTTPTLDRLISRGTYFAQAISVASTTVPSYSSVLTGLYPFQCVEKAQNVILMDTNLQTFVQKFIENGYDVFAELPEIVAISGLNKIFKNHNVFDTFATLYDDVGVTINNTLKSIKEPWFYYIHLMDLHGAAKNENNPELNKFHNTKFGKNNYEQMVSALDFWLGKIMSNIDFSNTLLIITSDHGSPTSEYTETMEKENQVSNKKRESSPTTSYKIGHKVATSFPEFMSPLRKKLAKTYVSKKNQSLTQDAQKRINELENLEMSSRNKRLFENAIMTTGNLFDEVCRIPLLFVGPGIPSNKIISTQIKNIDIFPTINEIIGFEKINNVSGKSLVPLLNDKDFNEEFILLQTITNNDDVKPKIGIRTSEYKYFRNEDPTDDSTFLFNLKNDPLEENNLAKMEPQKIESFEKIISDITGNLAMTKNKTNLTQEEIAHAEDILKKLGYV